jgi:diadenylate cyclase
VHGLWHHWSTDEFVTFARASVDVLVVAYLIYYLIMLAKGTRAWQIISGLLAFVLILWFSDWAQLTALKWLLQQMFLLGPVAIVVLFYPELRHALEEVGRLGFWGRSFTGLQKEDLSVMVGELVRTANNLSDKKIGALIVLERETGLTDIIETGTTVNGAVTAELLGTIFYPGSPLHDGAVIVRRGRIMAAGCTLPLSESRDIGTMVHTRHKAAIGMSEQSDALVLIVSEESGIISVAFDGKMVRGIRDDVLRDRLLSAYIGQKASPRRRRRRMLRATSRAVGESLTSLSPFRTGRRGRSSGGDDEAAEDASEDGAAQDNKMPTLTGLPNVTIGAMSDMAAGANTSEKQRVTLTSMPPLSTMTSTTQSSTSLVAPKEQAGVDIAHNASAANGEKPVANAAPQAPARPEAPQAEQGQSEQNRSPATPSSEARA